MSDGRFQLILVIAFLYLARGLFGDFFSCPPVSSGKGAYLHSDSFQRLTLRSSSAPDPGEEGQALPAAHTPFFFQGIPINSADKELLMTVKGIGPTLADSIISRRRNSGPLKDIEDLMKIPGVGTKRAAFLAPFLQFDENP